MLCCVCGPDCSGRATGALLMSVCFAPMFRSLVRRQRQNLLEGKAEVEEFLESYNEVCFMLVCMCERESV